MKIPAIQNNYIFIHKQDNSNRVSSKYCFNTGLTTDVFTKNVSFCGAVETSSVEDELSYDKFMARYHEVYGDKPINEIITKTIQNNDELNHGIEKRVYTIPKMEEYLIAHFYQRPHIDRDLPIEKCNIKYPRYNFAQPIAQNNYDIIIMKRIPGVPNSINNAYMVTEYICKNDCVTKEMAKEYLSKLRLFKDFPQESYNDLARQFKYLLDNGAFIDIINSNNLLVDSDHQRFHLIDLLTDEYNKLVKGLSDQHGGAKQGAHEMICLLLDPRFQYYSLEQLSLKEQKEIKNISKNVIKKCFAAAKDLSLSDKTDMVKALYKYIQSVSPTWGERFNIRYSEFLKLYKL